MSGCYLSFLRSLPLHATSHHPFSSYTQSWRQLNPIFPLARYPESRGPRGLLTGGNPSWKRFCLMFCRYTRKPEIDWSGYTGCVWPSPQRWLEKSSTTGHHHHQSIKNRMNLWTLKGPTWTKKTQEASRSGGNPIAGWSMMALHPLKWMI